MKKGKTLKGVHLCQQVVLYGGVIGYCKKDVGITPLGNFLPNRSCLEPLKRPSQLKAYDRRTSW